MPESTDVSPVSIGATTRRRWRFSLKTLLIVVPLLGAALGYLCIFVEWNVTKSKLARQIDPILTQHETTLAVQRDEITWLSLNHIPPSDAGNERLHQLGITHFHSSVGLQGARPVRDGELTQLLDRMPKLRVLDVRTTETTPAVLPRIARLKDLEWLWLDATHCTDESLKKLHGMRSLRRLSLDGSNVSTASIERLRAALPNCQVDVRP